MSLKVGQNVRLEIFQGETRLELDGRILQVGEREVMLTFPRYHVLPSVKTGAKALLRVWDHLGLHLAKTKVTRVTKVPDPGVIILAAPRSYQTVQKRSYFRLETSLALRFWKGALPAPDQLMMASRAVTEDVSAGGVRFKTLTWLNVAEPVHLAIDFPRGDNLAVETLAFPSRVVRVQESELDGEVQYTVGAQFDAVSESERDRMVKLLLDLQRKVR